MSLLELVSSMGLSTSKFANTHGGEYHGECPECGGRDRFAIQPAREGTRCTGLYSCRMCKIGGDTLKFCIEIMGLPYREAAERAGVSISPVPRIMGSKNKNERNAHSVAILTPPSKTWISKATVFTEWAHKHLLQNKDQLQYLEKRGLPLEAVVRYKLGYNPSILYRKRSDWGLEPQPDQELISVPPGLVIPFVEKSGRVTRLKIRRVDYSADSKFSRYKIIPGSMSGASIAGDRKLSGIIIVESELDAYALHNAAGDLLCMVAVGGSTKALDNVTAYTVATKAFILVGHDNDSAGIKMFDKWKKIYPHARACPAPKAWGKDIGEAAQAGFNIREWILGQIPPNLLHPAIQLESHNKAITETLPIEIIKEPEISLSPSIPVRAEKESAQDIEHKSAGDGWIKFDREILEWYLNIPRNQLPDPLAFEGCDVIINPKLYYEQLDREIAEGPRGVAASTGRLLSKLIKLKKYIDSHK